MNEESLPEFERILYRVSKTILKHYYVVLGMIYIGWALWVSFIFLVMIIIEATGAPYYLFYAILILTWFIALFSTIKNCQRSLGELCRYRKNEELEEFVNRADRISLVFWIPGIFIYMLIIITIPLIGYFHALNATASGLVILLATGNMGIFYSLKKYADMKIGIPLIVLTSMYLSAIILLVLEWPGVFVWSYTMCILLIAYIILALYCFMLLLK
ncbi:MAG: hypothetical protein J7L82_07150 [Staphylothermus sp.]|nr:hypothetical protein [Staphylothermus sp.]